MAATESVISFEEAAVRQKAASSSVKFLRKH